MGRDRERLREVWKLVSELEELSTRLKHAADEAMSVLGAEENDEENS